MTAFITNFEGFDHTSEELSAYTNWENVFTISLKSGSVINYESEDPLAFLQWLQDHQIRNIIENPLIG